MELGLLVDALHTVGLDALAQVDVGVRIHRHQDGLALGRMAAAIYRTAQLRLARGHLVRPELTQFERGDDGFVAFTTQVDTEERPPMIEITEYRGGRLAEAPQEPLPEHTAHTRVPEDPYHRRTG